MRLAWFRPDRGPSAFDHLAAVVDGLRETHDLHLVDARAAHDFVWQAAQGTYDLCVYELDDTAAHQYIWPYVLHYPGVLALHTSRLHDSRARTLAHQRRDADRETEMAFADGATRAEPPWPLVRGAWSTWRIPVLASRVTAVFDDALAAAITQSCPATRVVVTPVGVPDPIPPAAPPRSGNGAVRVLVADDASSRAVARAAARARDAGAVLEVVRGTIGSAGMTGDVVVATRWPTVGRPLTPALCGLASGKAVIVAETETTARWPALDPQTWQSRAVAAGPGTAEPPIVVSIDPRDEEHSLMLALVRLAGDPALRESLGRAARAWWEHHATVGHAVASWQGLLAEASALQPPPRPERWPVHLDATGDATARAILEPFGIELV